MGYSPKAQALRRCQAITKAGEPCRCWAIWGHPEQLCSTHAGRTATNWQRFIERRQALFAALEAGASCEQLARMGIQHARYPPCHCDAYPWPHRPEQGLNASTIGTTLNVLRNVYRRAVERGEVAVNPTAGLSMPAVRGGRDRIASPEEGARLLEALPAGDRALWATAMYAGLRRGELMALRVEDVDPANCVIEVRRGWDIQDGEISTNSRKPRRVPLTGRLRDRLDEHLLGLDWRLEPEGLVFGSTAAEPFSPWPLSTRAARAWRNAGLEQITLHECRHTFASLMIAAGVNAKALSTYMGHANISITLDLYGHLMPGNEEEAAALLDAYLERADTTARLAALEA